MAIQKHMQVMKTGSVAISSSDAGKDEKQEKSCYIPARFVVSFMAFMGIMFNYILRVNVNFALVAMVKHGNASSTSSGGGGEEELEDSDVCGFRAEMSESHGTYNGDLEWDEWTQGLVAGAFYWGNIITQLPGGRLAELYGPRRILGGAIATAAFLTVLLPSSARISPILFIAVRMLIGFVLGVCSPSTHALLSKWAPKMERSVMSSVIYAGGPAGTIVAFPLAATIINAFGWETVFYVQGAMTLLWCLSWFFIVADSPNTFRWITEDEKNYINESLGSNNTGKARSVPWKKVATSMPVWTIIVAALGNNWGFYTFLTAVPLYMKTMLHQDIKANALVSGLPYLGMWIFSLFIGTLGDFLQRKEILKTTMLRKIANTIANLGPALCLVGLWFTECDRLGTVSLLFVAVSLTGAIFSGHYVNAIDVAPNYAGTLCGIVNTLANIPGFLAPMTVGALINNQQTFERWQMVFNITAGIYLVQAVLYLIFGTAQEQSWNSESICSDPESPAPRNDDEGHDKALEAETSAKIIEFFASKNDFKNPVCRFNTFPNSRGIFRAANLKDIHPRLEEIGFSQSNEKREVGSGALTTISEKCQVLDKSQRNVDNDNKENTNDIVRNDNTTTRNTSRKSGHEYVNESFQADD
ncbi:putative inorganic phosphate cotransporter [Oratosquilla oratoria]|uniref:putative inorganic phosphate cotransporter n=1 Tax=Oratosquilla oratoria TaxID=337810 RepID=UPI003F770CA1